MGTGKRGGVVSKISIDLNDRLLNMIFTRGHCHSLALAINSIVGSELVMAMDNCGNPYHMGVLVGDNVLDIEGLQPTDSFIEKWGKLRVTTVDDFALHWEGDFEFDADEELAQDVAKALVSHHKIPIPSPLTAPTGDK